MAAAWLLCLTALGRLAGVSPARGYELSLYLSLPPTVWYLLLFSLLLHVLVAVQGCLGEGVACKLEATSGIAGVMVVTGTALLLPYLRGYPRLRGDFAIHVARSTEIATTGQIARGVFYPALYALVQMVHGATGLPVAEVWFVGGVGSYVLCTILSILAANSWLDDTRGALFVGLLAAIPISGAYVRTMSPASVVVQLLPLVVYLYPGRTREMGWGFNPLLCMLLVLLPFTHPLVSLMDVFWLLLFEIAQRWTARVVGQERVPAHCATAARKVHVPCAGLTASLILGTTWFSWLSSFALWHHSIRSVARWLGGEARTQLDKLAYLAERAGMCLWDAALLVLKQENGIGIYSALTIASLPVYLYLASKRGRSKTAVIYLAPLYALFVISALAALAAPFGPFGDLDFHRFLRFLVPWATLALGSVPATAEMMGPSGRLVLRSALTCALGLGAVAGIWALHPSPYVFQPNDQVTAQEIACMRWVYEHADGREIRGIWGLRSLANAALGHSSAESLEGIRSPLPEHFGYDSAASLVDVLDKPAYIVVTGHDRASVLDVWAVAGKYTAEDFRRLEEDPSVALLYANEQCRVWATMPTARGAQP